MYTHSITVFSSHLQSLHVYPNSPRLFPPGGTFPHFCSFGKLHCVRFSSKTPEDIVNLADIRDAAAAAVIARGMANREFYDYIQKEKSPMLLYEFLCFDEIEPKTAPESVDKFIEFKRTVDQQDQLPENTICM